MHNCILHWSVYLHNGLPFNVMTDHYALVYMIVKIGGDATGRLARLCVDLQPFTFSVTHRRGDQHLDADAVSRLLHKDDNIYIRTADDLRNDFEPLTNADREWLDELYPTAAGERHLGNFLSETISEYRKNGRDTRLSIESLPYPHPKPEAMVMEDHVVPDEDTSLTEKDIAAIFRANPQEASRVCTIINDHRAKVNDERSSKRVRMHTIYFTDTPTPIKMASSTATFLARQHTQVTHKSRNPLSGETKHIQYTTTAPIATVPTNIQPQRIYTNSSRVRPPNLTQSDIRKLVKARALMNAQYVSETEKRSRGRPCNTNPTEFAREDKLIRTLCMEMSKVKSQQDSVPIRLNSARHDAMVAERAQRERVKEIADAVEADRKAKDTAYGREKLRADEQRERKRATSALTRAANKRSRTEIVSSTNNEPITVLEDETPIQTEDTTLTETSTAPPTITQTETSAIPTTKTLKLKRSEVTFVVPTIAPVEAVNTEPIPPLNSDTGLWTHTEELIGARLLDYDYLHRKRYVDPTTSTLYEVVSVQAQKKQFFTSARPLGNDDTGEFNWDTCQERPIDGPTGTKALVAKQEEGTGFSGNKWPETPEDLVDAQNQDPNLAILLASLANTTSELPLHIPTKPHQTDPEKDYIFRRILANGTPGPLTRRTTKFLSHSHERVQYSIQKEVLQVVVPQHLITDCLFFHHEEMGHPGRNRTLNNLKQRYFWQTMAQDVLSHTKHCHHCMCRKANNAVATPPIQAYTSMEIPMSRTHIDLSGPFPLTRAGNRYTCVFKDALSKTVDISAIPDKSAIAVLRTLNDNVIHRLGRPRVLISDNGTEFRNKEMTKLCNMLGIIKRYTTPYNPNSDGQVENQMRTLKDSLSHYCNEFQDNWDESLGVIAFAYNTTVNDATGYTPYFLMYGREANSGDEDYERNPLPGGLPSYVDRMQRALNFAWEYVSKRVDDNVKTYNAVPAKRLQFKPYKVGDWFFRKIIPRKFYTIKGDKKKHTLSSKLQFRYAGPYMITRVINPVLYEAIIHGRRNQRIHAINMKSA